MARAAILVMRLVSGTRSQTEPEPHTLQMVCRLLRKRTVALQSARTVQVSAGRGRAWTQTISLLPPALAYGYAPAMEPGRPRNAWLRMTDKMGLTEPGRKPPRQSPRLLLFFTVLWSLSTVVWTLQVVRDVSRGNPDYLLKASWQLLFSFLPLLITRCGGNRRGSR